MTLVSCDQPSKELEEKEQVLTLTFVGWACDCPQWVRPKDLDEINQEDFDCFDQNVCVEIEPASPAIEIDPGYWERPNFTKTFRFTGRFYEELQDFTGNGGTIKAKVFRYTGYEYVDPSPVLKIVDPPVDIKMIKNLPFLTTTSGVVPVKETKKLCKPAMSGFFGHYQLINKNNKSFIGQLFVYTTDKPGNWRFDTNNEAFAEIQLVSNEIKVWDSLGVGTNKKDLLAFIGQNFQRQKGTVLQTDIGDYSAYFTILADTVSRLLIRKTCETKK